MAIKSSDQISIIDVTDAYSVSLTSEAFTVQGNTAGNALSSSSLTSTVQVYHGGTAVTAASNRVTVGTITSITGVTTSVSGLTITMAVTTACTGGELVIPITVDGEVSFEKKISITVAKTGATGATGNGITSVTYTYKTTTDQTAPAAGDITSTTIPALSSTNKYLWRKEVIAYTTSSSNKTTVSLIAVYGDQGIQGNTGATGNGISTITYYYKTTTTQTAPSAGDITATTLPTLSATNKYLWQKEVIAYTNSTNKTTVQLIGVYGDKGATGAAGADAITMTITSSAGTYFKNSNISTTLTAHVYKAGVELSSSTTPTLASMGTIKWYKDGGSTAVATGQTLAIGANDVTDKATYTAQLEG